MTEAGELVEVQGTGESHPFTRARWNELLDLCEAGHPRSSSRPSATPSPHRDQPASPSPNAARNPPSSALPLPLLSVLAEEHPADDVHVRVLLALHRVVAEVR